MFRKALATLAILMLPVTGAFAQTAGQSVTGFLLAQGSTYNGYTCPSTATSPCFVQYGASIPTSGGASTQDVNLKQVGGIATDIGTGAAGTGTQRVAVSSDSLTGIKGIDGATINGPFNPTAVIIAPSSTLGVSTQSCTTACASTIVSGGHAVYGISASATVTGWVLVYDATSCPANGTVTPKKAYAYTAANSTIGISWSDSPMVVSTGVAVCFSTSGPYTATSSTTAFLSVDYK